jgi:hypothetical protein
MFPRGLVDFFLFVILISNTDHGYFINGEVFAMDHLGVYTSNYLHFEVWENKIILAARFGLSNLDISATYLGHQLSDALKHTHSLCLVKVYVRDWLVSMLMSYDGNNVTQSACSLFG